MWKGSVPTKDATGNSYKTNNGERKRIMLTMSPNLFQRIKRNALKNKTSISKHICNLILRQENSK